MERKDNERTDKVRIMTGRTAAGVAAIVLVAVLLLVAIRFFLL